MRGMLEQTRWLASCARVRDVHKEFVANSSLRRLKQLLSDEQAQAGLLHMVQALLQALGAAGVDIDVAPSQYAADVLQDIFKAGSPRTRLALLDNLLAACLLSEQAAGVTPDVAAASRALHIAHLERLLNGVAAAKRYSADDDEKERTQKLVSSASSATSCRRSSATWPGALRPCLRSPTSPPAPSKPPR